MKTQNILNTLHLSLLNVDYTCVRNWNFRNVISPFTRIYLIQGGEGHIIHNHKKLVLQAGKLYLIPSFTKCNYLSNSYIDHYYIHFTPQIVGGTNIYELFNFNYEHNPSDEDTNLVKKILQLNPGKNLINIDPCKYSKSNLLPETVTLDSSCQVASYIETQGMLLQLFSRFIKNNANNDKNRNLNSLKQISRAVDHINLNLAKPINISELAKICHLSDDYFSRLFMKITGTRPVDYINRKKIESSQLMLITSDDSIEKVAMETGIDNFSYFTRLFKKYSGTTPSEYRKLHKLV